MEKLAELALMIDHSILNPMHTDEDLAKQCQVAQKFNVASPLGEVFLTSPAVNRSLRLPFA
ncbi:MAG: hypothetical protein JW798_14100 [Prolixibacteraceae bacterium]|nr:hypothetical protein [Prolixibacteraceae bacterium]